MAILKTDQVDFENSTSEEIKGKHGDLIENSASNEWDFHNAVLKNASLEGGSDDSYTNADYPDLTTKTKALDYLLYLFPDVTSFVHDGSTTELGGTVNNVNLTWTINKSIKIQTINNGVGEITNTLRTIALINQGLVSTTTWTITVTDDSSNSDIASTTLKFLNKIRTGTSPNGSLNNAQILALPTGVFVEASSFPYEYTTNGNGEYLYIALPSSFGALDIVVNGLASTAWVETLHNYTNGSGYTEQYRVYRSTFLQNGTGINIQLNLQ